MTTSQRCVSYTKVGKSQIRIHINPAVYLYVCSLLGVDESVAVIRVLSRIMSTVNEEQSLIHTAALKQC